jgi:hypothetical protein
MSERETLKGIPSKSRGGLLRWRRFASREATEPGRCLPAPFSPLTHVKIPAPVAESVASVEK